MIIKGLIAVIITIASYAIYLYIQVSYYEVENETLTINNATLEANIITQKSKCEEDIAIEKANVRIKEVIKYKTRYIKKVSKDEKATNDKFMLDSNTIK